MSANDNAAFLVHHDQSVLMANQQRSFFDQDTKSRPTRFNSDRGPKDMKRTPELRQRPPADPTSFAASSESKTKLKAFLFEGHNDMLSGDRHMAKEQQDDKENAERDLKKPATVSINPPPQPSSQTSASKDLRDCPQTPIGRLPLSELLANNDDPRHYPDLTPIERVLWDNSPLSSATPRSTRKGKKRKRAQSSSPASLPQNQSSKYFAGSERPVYGPGLQEALKTPKADLVDDLWSRYSIHTTEKRSPTAQFNVQFPQHMHSSSPAPDLPNREGTGLRRAFSCIDWPTSAAKRRKLRVNSSQTRTFADLGRFDKPLDSAEKRKSRVSLLVERIHHHLAKPVHPQEFSSSDPGCSPDISKQNSPANDTPVDPYSQAQIDNIATTLSQAAMDESRPISQPSMLPADDFAGLDRAEGLSDFDDDDLVIGMMEVLSGAVGEDEIETAKVMRPGYPFSQKLRAPSRNNQDPECASPVEKSRPAPTTTAKRLTEAIPPKPITAALVQHPDEFDDDDDDDDVTAAELEGVFAKYDTQTSFRTAPARACGAGETGLSKKEGSSNDAHVVSHEKPAMAIEMLSDDDDDFGGDSDFEQIAAEVAASQTQQERSKAEASSDRRLPILQRHIIKAIAEGEYETSAGQKQPEKVLFVQSEITKLSKAIILRQTWLDTPCKTGSYVHLVGDFDQYGYCTVDNTQNLLILHPDHLISATVVGDSFTCMRKAVLGDRVKATSNANQATLYGHMLHEIFQEALRANRWDDEWMMSAIERVATNHLEGLFELNIEHAIVLDQLKARVVDLQAWAEIFIAAEPKPNAVVKDRNGAQSLMCVNKLLEVEEKVWSPMFGLKGNVDATVQVRVANGTDKTTLTVPFELKTGKHSSAAHKAQTALYTLLLSDRYDLDIACGILYYMQTSEISSIRTFRHELVPMIIQRNHLAGYIRSRELPPLLRKAYTCGKCFAQTPCFIYHKMIDDGDGESSGVGEKFEDLTGHLKPEHQTFFSKWDTLLTKEEKDVVLLRRELWTMESSEREKTGRCFGDLIIDPGSFHETDAPKINRFAYKFIKQRPTPGFTFTESQLGLGEPIVVSDEKGHFALANGYVTEVQRRTIEVTIDRRLHNARAKEKDFDAERNQVFGGIMKVMEDGASRSTLTPPHPEEPVVYRLDKDEFSNGMAMVRNNLIRLMEKDVFGVQTLRRLVIEGVAPTFKPMASAYTLGDTASQANLNVDQTAAIEKVMSAKDYALVLGMPGTGKTTTIAYIIRALVAQGKNVLLTSYTHTAVDNILLKLRKDKIGIFRVGALAKIHAEVQEFADISSKPMKTLEELKRCYTQQVIATTCLGINHPIFNQRIFDYCIVDEASQITLPVCLGPIRMSRAFILVGDHYQLPPLVQNKEAREGGLDISLFKMLSDAHPSSVTNLEHQYRMCSDIMTLSNTLIYNGRLKCGTPEVANRCITIPDMSALKKHHYTAASILSTTQTRVCANPTPGTCWLRDLLDPTMKACFVNTDPLGSASREVLESGARITNPAEATLTNQLVESLITTDVPPKDIGVITLYRSQLALIKHFLRHRPGVEMHTADRFQGRDKEIIVLSLVRSNETQIVGDLLKDWRRINVALTRARTKLLVIGSKSTLVGTDLLKVFVELMESKNWIYDLPASALEGHSFEDGVTQFSSAKGSAIAEEGMAIAPTAAIEKKELMKRMANDREKGLDKENRFGRRKPAKQATLDVGRLLGARPVLRDIVNDAS